MRAALLIIGWLNIIVGIIAFIVLVDDEAVSGFMVGGSSVIFGVLFLAASEVLSLLEDIRDSLARSAVSPVNRTDKKEKNTFEDLPKL